MQFLDLSDNPRLPMLLNMVEILSKVQDSRQVLDTIIQGYQQAYQSQSMIILSVVDLEAGSYRISRIKTFDGREQFYGRQDVFEAPDSPVLSGGVMSQIIATPEPKILHKLHLYDDPLLKQIIPDRASAMASPIFDNGKVALWSLVFDKNPNRFTADELENFVVRSNLISTAVRAIQATAQLRDATNAIQHEVDRMAAIQQAMLPDELPPIPGLDVRASYETFDRVGGDLYDFQPICSLPNGGCDLHGPWAILIADASGHGPSAAVISAMVHTLMRAFPRKPTCPSEILKHTNEHLLAKRIESNFVTAILLFYDPKTRVIQYSCAGHPPALHKKTPGPGPVEQLPWDDGVPLGIMMGAQYSDHTITLEPGQSVVLYTDGVSEAINPNGEMFGLAGIKAALSTCDGRDASCVMHSLRKALKNHEAGTRSRDDQAIVTLHAR